MDSHWILYLIVVLFCVVATVAQDYYETLGVERTANDKQIKRQFRQLGEMSSRPSTRLNNMDVF
jgi:preprotein translocase subunit Sec63